MDLSKFIKNLEDDSFYYSDYDFVTNSQLGLVKKDVRTYRFLRDNPQYRTNTQAMTFGRAYHVAMLEPNEFNDKVDVVDSTTRTTKVWKEYVANNPDSPTIILKKEYDRIMRMQDVLFSHPEVCNLLSPDGETEIANAWEDPDTGVFCKGKCDYRNGRTLIDLKTTQDCSPKGFSSSCWKYGYDRQSAFYADGFDCDNFIFIVQEKEAPYNVAIYECSQEFMERGREEYKNLLFDYRKFFIDEEEDLSTYLIQGVLT